MNNSADDKPPSMTAELTQRSSAQHVSHNASAASSDEQNANLVNWLTSMFKPKQEPSLREAIEEYIEEPESYEDEPTISAEERVILSNILKLQSAKVIDVMVPRADIIAIEQSTTQEELFSILAERQFSRIPVYRETLDDVIGTIHMKDIMATLAKGIRINVPDLLTGIPIVSPSMSIMDLVVEMRKSRRHMVMVVDEYGGIDGLVTIGDIIQEIIGEIDDEHDIDHTPEIANNEDGSISVDGRLDIGQFEEQYGAILSDEEREDSDTMGGLISTIAGRVPARGEILTHDSGMVFEVLDAGPRRVGRVKISKIPAMNIQTDQS